MLLPLTLAASSCFATAASLAALFLRVGNTPRDETIVSIDDDAAALMVSCNNNEITRQRQCAQWCESVVMLAAETRPPTFCE
jgi:hypothetical protein